MTELLRQIADDLRAVRGLMERQAGRGSFAAALRGLRDRGVITQEDIDRLEEDGTLNAQRPTLNDQGDKGKETDMQTMVTPGGITLETLPEDYYKEDRAAAVLAVALYCLGFLALIGAGALCAACLRGCAADPAPAGAAACYEANWSRGLYADELADWRGAGLAEGMQ